MRVLLIDDDPEPIAALLRESGCSVTTARGIRAGWERLAIEEVDLLVIEPSLRDGDGFSLARERPTGVALLLVTGSASVEGAVAALRLGAVDYLPKPIDAARLLPALRRAAQSHQGAEGGIGPMPETRQRCGSLRGASASMQEVYKLVTRAAPEEVTVCLSGESGTGKEMVARVLHQLSPRREAPFVTVNCGAINGELAESLLFGHERGSFTGAERTHRGIFEQAGAGTLFLDEVTEMPLELQVKLLRVLEGGSLMRIGGENPITLGARVICATNRAPERAVQEGHLRPDLWYRLNVFPIGLPPLRERHGDVSLLAAYFLQELNVARESPWRWHPQALEALEAHWWPGNVRELKNTIYRSVLLATEPGIRTIELIGEPGPRPAEGRQALPPGMIELPLGSTVAEAERRLILATLAQCKGNKQSAANRLGVSLKRLYSRLHSYNRSNPMDS